MRSGEIGGQTPNSNCRIRSLSPDLHPPEIPARNYPIDLIPTANLAELESHGNKCV